MPDMVHFPMGKLDKARECDLLPEFIFKALSAKYGTVSAEMMAARVLEEVNKTMVDVQEFDGGLKRTTPKPRPPNVNRLTVEVTQQVFKVGHAYWTTEVQI
mgnify:CR=1 FL=1